MESIEQENLHVDYGAGAPHLAAFGEPPETVLIPLENKKFLELSRDDLDILIPMLQAIHEAPRN